MSREPETFVIALWADDEDDASRQAREWAAAEPAWSFAGILAIRQPYPDRRHWYQVELIMEPLELTLGLSA